MSMINATIAMINANYCGQEECRETRQRVVKSIRRLNESGVKDTCDHVLAFLAEDTIGCPCCGKLRTPDAPEATAT
jgi:hypothetical protein